MKLGKFEIYPVLDGLFRLDGGAMFGVVPKVMWDKTNPPDKNNRILLALRCCLVNTGKELILIDTGIGDKGQDKFNDIYQVNHHMTLEACLQQIGFNASDINIVINTHLHFDHCGGNTKLDADGKVIPTFPNAQYYIQKIEWEAANNPDRRSKASYLTEDFVPLQENNQVQLVDEKATIADGVEVIMTAGHTYGHQVVKVSSENQTLIYWGDLIPTASHLSLPFLMAYDLFPLQTMEHKKILLSQAIKENWVSFFEHDPKIAMAYLISENRRIKIKTVIE
ncbi:MAG: MBL fold metallo-hydrolase [Candidatus Latescibacteria bacterium]|nr:MBL fold metallo-hydrolase [Candidatus Latescibacterota bacterium]